MGVKNLDIEEGIAVDKSDTKKHDQIFNIIVGEDYNSFHYTVFSHELKKRIPRKMTRKLIKVLSNEELREGEEKREAAYKAIDSFYDGIRSAPSVQGFSIYQPYPSLTYAIDFDDNYEVLRAYIKPSLGVMSEKAAVVSDVDDKACSEKVLLKCRIWKHLMKEICREDIGNFRDLSTLTTRFIGKMAFDYAVQNKLNCVYTIENRVRFDDYMEVKRHHGNTAKFSVQDIGQEYDLSKIKVSASSGGLRKTDNMNLIALREHALSGKNVFSSALVEQLADFRNLRYPKKIATSPKSEKLSLEISQ